MREKRANRQNPKWPRASLRRPVLKTRLIHPFSACLQWVKRRIGTTPQTAKALLFARGPARIRNAADRPKPCPMGPKAIGHFATVLIAPKPVKPCDRAIFGALNSLSKREQNAPGAGCLRLAFSPPAGALSGFLKPAQSPPANQVAPPSTPWKASPFRYRFDSSKARQTVR